MCTLLPPRHTFRTAATSTRSSAHAQPRLARLPVCAVCVGAPRAARRTAARRRRRCSRSGTLLRRAVLSAVTALLRVQSAVQLHASRPGGRGAAVPLAQGPAAAPRRRARPALLRCVPGRAQGGARPAQRTRSAVPAAPGPARTRALLWLVRACGGGGGGGPRATPRPPGGPAPPGRRSQGSRRVDASYLPRQAVPPDLAPTFHASSCLRAAGTPG